MIEIVHEGIITNEEIAQVPAENLEKFIEQKISEGIKKEIEQHINEMSFIDMEVNSSTGNFEIKAELVLCSKQDIVNNIQMQSVKMAQYGLGQDAIIDILETQAEPSKGF